MAEETEVKTPETEVKEEKKPDLTALESKLTYLDSELKKVIKERDEAKGKLRGISDEEALKKGEYEKLLQERNTELETLKTQLAEAGEFKTKYEAFETQTKAELLESLSDEHKDIAKDLPLEKLKAYVKVNSEKKLETDGSRSGGKLTFTTDGKEWKDFTSKELEEIKEKNPALFEQLKKKFLKN